MTRLLTLISALLLTLLVHAVELGDDGLHKAAWFSYTFKDVREDIATAAAEDKHLLIMFEQRGCIYCTQMHEEVFSQEDVANYLSAHFMVVQYNMDGSEEVVDTDGETLEEREAFEKWELFTTPTLIFMPKDLADDANNAAQMAIQVVPGAYDKWTTLHMLKWISEEAYTHEPNFQKFHAQQLQQAREQGLL